MSILTKDQLREAGKPRQEEVPLPGLGEGASVVVRGYTCAARAAIIQGSVTYDERGLPQVDRAQDDLLSLVACLVDPAITLEDTEWAQNLASGVVETILAKANELSGRTQSAYDEFKTFFRQNPLAARFYTVCVEKLGRFPSEVPATEEEFMSYLAAAEVEGEDDAAAVEAQIAKLQG